MEFFLVLWFIQKPFKVHPKLKILVKASGVPIQITCDFRRKPSAKKNLQFNSCENTPHHKEWVLAYILKTLHCSFCAPKNLKNHETFTIMLHIFIMLFCLPFSSAIQPKTSIKYSGVHKVFKICLSSFSVSVYECIYSKYSNLCVFGRILRKINWRLLDMCN